MLRARKQYLHNRLPSPCFKADSPILALISSVKTPIPSTLFVYATPLDQSQEGTALPVKRNTMKARYSTDKENTDDTFRIQQIGICHSMRSQRSALDRPSTSHTHQPTPLNRRTFDFQGCRVPKEVFTDKISISKALIDYSVVFRKNSVERITVRRKSRIGGKSVSLSAKRVLLQQKQKLEQKQVRKPLCSPRERYAQVKVQRRLKEEAFAIVGWDIDGQDDF